MAVSEQEEDNEVAEILQHQLYYNGDVLDSSLEVVAKYKDQSVAYLDSVINFAYVLLRMLERYSKTKTFMFIRKRKAARKKRKEIAENPEAVGTIPDEENEADLEADRDMPSYAEHAFTFTAFEKVCRGTQTGVEVLMGQRFAQENVVNTLLTYLARFQEFEDPEQMKRVVGLMHRQVVRSKAEGLYFRVSLLD
jgi:replication fork protection complex subunit Tof1/Swi1